MELTIEQKLEAIKSFFEKSKFMLDAKQNAKNDKKQITDYENAVDSLYNAIGEYIDAAFNYDYDFEQVTKIEGEFTGRDNGTYQMSDGYGNNVVTGVNEQDNTWLSYNPYTFEIEYVEFK